MIDEYTTSRLIWKNDCLLWLVPLAYLLLYMSARYIWIVRPSYRQLAAQLDSQVVRLKAMKADLQDGDGKDSVASNPEGGPQATHPSSTQPLLEELKKLKRDLNDRSLTFVTFFIGNEVYMRYWRKYHRLELQALMFDEAAQTKWRSISPKALIGIPTDESTIQELEQLQSRMIAVDSKPSDGQQRNLIYTTAAFAYEIRDNFYARLADWHNKASLLVLGALTLIVAFGFTIEFAAQLLLLGSLGGLLAKLRTTIDRADVPTDYGTSWTTLFLTPLVGALTGFAGVVLLAWSFEVQVGGITAPHDLEPLAPTAILFGYSAALFDRLYQSGQAKLGIR